MVAMGRSQMSGRNVRNGWKADGGPCLYHSTRALGAIGEGGGETGHCSNTGMILKIIEATAKISAAASPITNAKPKFTVSANAQLDITTAKFAKANILRKF